MKSLFTKMLAICSKSSKRGTPSLNKRPVRLGLECLEERALMTASMNPVPAPTQTITYNPPKVAPPADTDNSSEITNLTAKAVSETQINLTWSGGGGASGNYICELISGKWMEIGYTNAANNFAVQGLTAGTTYQFKIGDLGVFADVPGDLFYSPTVSATTPSRLGVPALSGKAVSPSQVNLSWTQVEYAAGYEVQRYVNGAWTTIAYVAPNSLGYAVTGLYAASLTSFRVAAYTTTEMGAFSSVQSILTWPAAPSNFVATPVSTSQINLSWSAVGGITGYMVYVKVGQGAWTWLKNTAVGQTSIGVTGLTAGVTYTFDVGASNSAGTTFANPINATAQVGLPAAPTNFFVQAYSTTQAQLTWSAVAGATSYVIYMYTSSGWKSIATTANSYIDFSGMTSGATYYFDVAAVNAAGPGNGAKFVSITMP